MPGDAAVGVHDEQTAHAAAAHPAERFCERGAERHVDRAARHYLRDARAARRQVLRDALEHDVAVGDDADEALCVGRIVGDEQRADMAIAHQASGLGEARRTLDAHHRRGQNTVDFHHCRRLAAARPPFLIRINWPALASQKLFA
jgi:hypothetical protein